MKPGAQTPNSWIWKFEEEIDFEYLRTFTRDGIHIVSAEELPTASEVELGHAEIMGERVFIGEDDVIVTMHPKGHEEFITGTFDDLLELAEAQELYLMRDEGLISHETAQILVTNLSISIIDEALRPMENGKVNWSREVGMNPPAMIKIVEGHSRIYGLDPDGNQSTSWETIRTPHNFEPRRDLK